MSSIVSAIIAAFAAIVVCIYENRLQLRQFEEIRKDQAAEAKRRHDESLEMITYKIDQLSDRVDKHNNLIERTYELEKEAEILKEQIKVANHRIEDLENI